MLNLLEYEYRDIEKVLESVFESAIDYVRLDMDDILIRPFDRYHLEIAIERIAEILDRARARAIINQFLSHEHEMKEVRCDSSPSSPAGSSPA